ncbi:MAG: transcriptional repressor [Clostridiales bacterium]|nr:transcriptional repressor [Clostridiales bacterium]
MQDNFKEILKERGLKVTSQRVLVLDILSQAVGEHLTAEEIYNKVKSKNPDIGLATVYRTIQLLSELKLVDKIVLNDGCIRYEIAGDEANSGHHHHHLICVECGKLTSFSEDLLENLECAIMEKKDFLVLNHEVKLYGYCSECREKHAN